MKLLKVRLFSCVVGAMLIALLLAPAVAQAQAAPWSVVKSPNPGVAGNELLAAASVSANDVWAVGEATNTTGQVTLTEHWNGTAWSVVPSPSVGSGNNNLFGVAAVSTTDVWAVGLSGSGGLPLIERWDGTSWSVVSSPNVGSGFNTLQAAAAVSTNEVWAVGQSSTASGAVQTLIEQWNGTTWSVIASPGAGELRGIAILSATDIWAVGSVISSGVEQTVIEQWNGTAWTVVSSPNPSESLNILDAAATDPSSGQAWAVGVFENASSTIQTLTEFNP